MFAADSRLLGFFFGGGGGRKEDRGERERERRIREGCLFFSSVLFLFLVRWEELIGKSRSCKEREGGCKL